MTSCQSHGPPWVGSGPSLKVLHNLTLDQLPLKRQKSYTPPPPLPAMGLPKDIQPCVVPQRRRSESTTQPPQGCCCRSADVWSAPTATAPLPSPVPSVVLASGRQVPCLGSAYEEESSPIGASAARVFALVDALSQPQILL